MKKTLLSIWQVSNQVPHRNPMDHKHIKISFFTNWVAKILICDLCLNLSEINSVIYHSLFQWDR